VGNRFSNLPSFLRSLSLSILIFDRGPANRAALQAMDKSFPEWPALFFDFVLPSRSKDLFSNFWIADPHGTTPTLNDLGNSEKVLEDGPRLDFVAEITNVQAGD
jgi:hypothetical protein